MCINDEPSSTQIRVNELLHTQGCVQLVSAAASEISRRVHRCTVQHRMKNDTSNHIVSEEHTHTPTRTHPQTILPKVDDTVYNACGKSVCGHYWNALGFQLLEILIDSDPMSMGTLWRHRELIQVAQPRTEIDSLHASFRRCHCVYDVCSGWMLCISPSCRLLLTGDTLRDIHCMLHREGGTSPATPGNQNNDQSSRGNPQEAVQP